MKKCTLTQVPCRKAIAEVVKANKNKKSLQLKAIASSTVSSAIDNVLKRLRQQGIEIERFTHHAFRDTFATRYVEEGGNMQTLQKILGHSSLAMTADLYAHVLPNTKQQEMQQIENGFIGVAVL